MPVSVLAFYLAVAAAQFSYVSASQVKQDINFSREFDDDRARRVARFKSRKTYDLIKADAKKELKEVALGVVVGTVMALADHRLSGLGGAPRPRTPPVMIWAGFVIVLAFIALTFIKYIYMVANGMDAGYTNAQAAEKMKWRWGVDPAGLFAPMIGSYVSTWLLLYVIRKNAVSVVYMYAVFGLLLYVVYISTLNNAWGWDGYEWSKVAVAGACSLYFPYAAWSGQNKRAVVAYAATVCTLAALEYSQPPTERRLL